MNSPIIIVDHQNWLDEVIQNLKKLKKVNYDHDKNFKKQITKNTTIKASIKLIEKANTLTDSFLKSVKKIRKGKNLERRRVLVDFNKSMTLKLNELNQSGELMDSKHLKQHGEIVLSLLKEQLVIPEHTIWKVMKEFFNAFEEIYTKIWNSPQLKKLFEQTKAINTGELGIDCLKERCPSKNINSNDEGLLYLVEKVFFDTRCFADLILNSLPKYYDGEIEQEVFDTIKEQLNDFILNQYLRDSVYNILFTFSRVSTIDKEQKLFECIGKANLQADESTWNDINIIDYLYKQIHPDFRMVQIERDGFSLATSLHYISHPDHVSRTSMNNMSSNTTDFSSLRLKYENGAQKLVGMDYCQSPMEKIFMVKLVSESIKQDGQICMEANTKPLQICSDTLVSIFAYIVALSRNHLLYAHLHLANELLGEEIRDKSCEGMYLVILQASLSLLCNYQETTEECLVSISQYEVDDDQTKSKNLDDLSCCMTSTPKTKVSSGDRESFYEEDESFRQMDYYVSKDFFEHI